MNYIISLILFFAVGLTTVTTATAQNYGERGEVRKGNRAYVDEDFSAAAEHYAKALEHSPTNFEAQFNLGCAMLKGGDTTMTIPLFEMLAQDSLLTNRQRAESYYNLGNAQFAQQQLQEALESYKSAMRLDPDDVEAKYNYAYTKSLLQQQQDQSQDQNQDDSENQDENQDQQDQGDQEQEQEQNQDQQDQGDQDQDENQDQNQDQQDQGDQEQEQQEQQQPQDGQISEQEREQMLDAIQAQEDKTQDDLKERARGVVIQGVKNW